MSAEKKLNIKGIVKGVAFSLIITFILILVIAAICYFFTISDKLLSVLVMAAVGISVFVSSLLVAENTKNSGLLHGLLIAAIYMLVIFVSKITVSRCFSADITFLTSLISALAFGALGGIVGIRQLE